MTRGPHPLKAQDESLLIAEKRGLVMRYQHRRGNICDFSLMSPGLVRFVCAMRLIRLSSTPEDILHYFAEVIGQLRFIALSPAISRELWLRTPRGAWRFFRVLDDGILEVDNNGMPLANGTGLVKDTPTASCAGTIARPEAARSAGQKIVSDGQDAALKKPEPGKNSLPGPEGNPGKVPVPVFTPADNPVKKSGTETVPVQSTATENDPGPAPETEDAPPPGINLELIRRFMRWRKEQQKKVPGSG